MNTVTALKRIGHTSVRRTRERRQRLFDRFFTAKTRYDALTVLDVGGTVEYWGNSGMAHHPMLGRTVILNTFPQSARSLSSRKFERPWGMVVIYRATGTRSSTSSSRTRASATSADSKIRCGWPARSGGWASTTSCRPRITSSRWTGTRCCRSFTGCPCASGRGASSTSSSGRGIGRRAVSTRWRELRPSGISGRARFSGSFRVRAFVGSGLWGLPSLS